MDHKLSSGSYDDILSTRPVGLSDCTQTVQDRSRSNLDESSLFDLEQSPIPSNHLMPEETSGAGYAPAATLPDNFPSSQSAAAFRILWQKVWSVQRYKDYRYGHSMSQKAKKDRNKWPFPSEEAFWRACACIPPRHRRKEPYPGRSKPLGRNEAIAAYINDTLGLIPNPDGPKKPWPLWDETPEELQELTRKNISSHLQVLRPWFQDVDQFVFSWISGDHGEESPRRGSLSPINRERRRHSRHPTPYPARRLSSLADAYLSSRSNSVESQQSFPVLRSQYECLSTSSIDCFKFSMFSQACPLRYSAGHVCGSGSTCGFENLHTFTKTTAGGGMPDTHVSESDLYRRFPALLYANPRKHSNSRIVFAEASVALPSQEFSLDGSVNLDIDGRFATKDMLRPLSLWYCRTVFYDAGEFQAEFEQLLEEVNHISERDVFSHYLPFASGYWVRKLSELISYQRKATALELEHHANKHGTKDGHVADQRKATQADKAIKDLHEKVSKGINRLSARQEILEYPCPQNNEEDSSPLTHLTICWKFRQTQAGEEGATQFRNIVVQPAESYLNVSRQQSLEKRFSFDEQKRENTGPTSSPYINISQGLNDFSTEANMDGSLFGNYDFSAALPYQPIPEKRPYSSISNVNTIASENSSLSASFHDFTEYRDELCGKQMSIDNSLHAGIPPTTVSHEQQSQNLNSFIGGEIFSYEGEKPTNLNPTSFPRFDRTFASVTSQASNTNIGMPQSNLWGQHDDSRHHIPNQLHPYPTPYFGFDFGAMVDGGMLHDSQEQLRFNQQSILDEQFLEPESYMTE